MAKKIAPDDGFDPRKSIQSKNVVRTLEEEILLAVSFPTMRLWQKITSEDYDIQYDINIVSDDPKKWYASPNDDYTARLREYGSGTLGKPAEFWFEKAQQDFNNKVKSFKTLEELEQYAAEIDKENE